MTRDLLEININHTIILAAGNNGRQNLINKTIDKTGKEENAKLKIAHRAIEDWYG